MVLVELDELVDDVVVVLVDDVVLGSGLRRLENVFAADCRVCFSVCC